MTMAYRIPLFKISWSRTRHSCTEMEHVCVVVAASLPVSPATSYAPSSVQTMIIFSVCANHASAEVLTLPKTRLHTLKSILASLHNHMSI